MKIVQQYTPSKVNLGHATSQDNTNNTSAYMVFPKAFPSCHDISFKKSTCYALFAEGAANSSLKKMEMAAQISVESMYRYMLENSVHDMSLRNWLEAVLCHANSTLIRLSQKKQIQSALHTSALATCIDRGRFYITYSGEISAYLLRGKFIYYLPHAVTPNQSHNGATHRNILNYIKRVTYSPQNFLGQKAIPLVKHISFNIASPPASEADSLDGNDRRVMDYLQLRPDDAVVLCSNSVSRALSSYQIEEITTALPSQLAAEEMIQTADRLAPRQHHTAVVLRQKPVMPSSVDYITTNRHRRYVAAAAD